MKATWKVNHPQGYVTLNGKKFKDGDEYTGDPENIRIMRHLYQRGLLDVSGRGSTQVTAPASQVNWSQPDKKVEEENA